MAVKIRLSRIGKKNNPFFRVVAIDSRRKRDGKALEILGTYNPHTGEFIQFHNERIEAWIKLGAIASETVKKLQKLYRKSATSTTTSIAA